MAKILIVEDDKDIALGLEEDLTRHGFQVETVGDGEKALSRSKECHWDLILLDLMLPRKDGFEVCKELRRDGIKTPLIMLTAKTHEAEKIFGLEIGADDYITKPFSALRENLPKLISSMTMRLTSTEVKSAAAADL
jgi:two-component system alkaline phosphatase synthesis response regulator PhoP